MADLIDTVMDPIENGFRAIGLMDGPNAPFMRFVLVGSVSGLIISQIKPKMFFHNNVPRPWGAFSGMDSSMTEGVEPVAVPWWAVPVGLGAIAGMFI